MPSPLACPTCGLAYKVADIHLSERVALCRACDRAWPLAPVKPRVAATPPAVWKVDESRDGLVLRKRWFGFVSLFLTVWCAIWDGILLVFALNTPVQFLPFMLIHTAIGVAITWYTVCTYVNTTTLAVVKGRLVHAHGPLWWPGGNVDLAAEDIDQLHVVAHRGKTTSYQVVATVKGGVARPVTPSTNALDEARWLEQTLEDRLGIVDRAMEGEATA